MISLYQRYSNALWLALALLTRLPTPQSGRIEARDSGLSVLFYPLVGLIIGVILYLPVLVFPDVSALLLSAVIVSLWAIITGGLHLDGLADSADAWLGGLGERERMQRIMKDPLLGSAGVIAIVCVLILKFAALTSLLQQEKNLAILIAPVIGRSMILLLFLSTPYVSKQGMASDMVAFLPGKQAYRVLFASLIPGLIYSFRGLLLVLIIFWFLRRLMLKLLGGCTGDTLGASVEISEMMFLLSTALFL